MKKLYENIQRELDKNRVDEWHSVIPLSEDGASLLNDLMDVSNPDLSEGVNGLFLHENQQGYIEPKNAYICEGTTAIIEDNDYVYFIFYVESGDQHAEILAQITRHDKRKKENSVIKLYEIYANDEFWDKTSCPFGSEVLNREAYEPIERSELDVYELCEQLTAAKIDYIETKNSLHTELQWEDDDCNQTIEVGCYIYVHEGYIYNIKMAWTDGVCGYSMTREPRFNKKYL